VIKEVASFFGKYAPNKGYCRVQCYDRIGHLVSEAMTLALVAFMAWRHDVRNKPIFTGASAFC
jgi:hypothetical protein